MREVALQGSSPIVWSIAHRRVWAALLLGVIGVVALAISAKIEIPWWPVPMTMQTYVVLVIGMAYGTRLGVATVLAYLAIGALGFPVFAGTPERGIGIVYMIGPTGGYLLGFAVAAWLCGVFTARGWDRRLAYALIGMALAHVVILGVGVLWLSALVGWERAIRLGVIPFVAATVAKTLLAGWTLPAAWRLVDRLSS